MQHRKKSAARTPRKTGSCRGFRFCMTHMSKLHMDNIASYIRLLRVQTSQLPIGMRTRLVFAVQERKLGGERRHIDPGAEMVIALAKQKAVTDPHTPRQALVHTIDKCIGNQFQHTRPRRAPHEVSERCAM